MGQKSSDKLYNFRDSRDNRENGSRYPRSRYGEGNARSKGLQTWAEMSQTGASILTSSMQDLQGKPYQSCREGFATLFAATNLW